MSTAIHDFAPEEIMAHHDGELPPDRAQQVSAHLESCVECRDLAYSLGTTSESLSVWSINSTRSALQPNYEPSSLMDRVNSSGASSWWQELRVRPSTLTLGTVALLVVLAMIGITANTPKFSSTGTRARSSSVDNVTVNTKLRPPLADKLADYSNDRVSRKRQEVDQLATPGLAADSDGLFHGLGDHASKSASIDGQPTTQVPMIARTADLQILATNLDSARAGLETVLSRHHGYAANLNASNAQNTARTLNASLRIPSPELNATLVELKSIGHVVTESQSGEEVTGQHADLVARLKNSRETETRLQDILRTRTGKVRDVLEVEQEIARVRGDIEQMESELKGLDHRVDFATVNLTITEEYKAKVSDTTPGVATRFHNAAVAGLTNVTDSAVGLALWLAEFLPPIIFWLIILAAPAATFWRMRRRAIAAATASPLS